VTADGESRCGVVAVDAMGGDNAPAEVLKGAVEAHRRGADVVLVGDERVITPILSEIDGTLRVVHANGAISMHDHVTRSLLKEQSSLRTAADLVMSGDAGAVVSAGNSAAIMAIGLSVFGRLPGIGRPAFGGTLPARNQGVFVLDIGANSSVKASNLIQFAVMGHAFVQLSSGISEPRIGLLSNGSEDSKGTQQVREANEALRKLDINFIGNVEGNQVFEGGVDVVVCDGFAGNILLKGAEGVASEIFELLKSELSKDFVARVAGAALMPVFSRIKRRVDYEEYGGVPVLGVNHVMVNCHGRSKAKAVTNAILLAAQLARERLPERIGRELREDELELGRRRRWARALHLKHD